MKYKKILPISDEMFNKVKTRVIIHRDKFPPDPLHDMDQVFLIHSNIRDFGGNECDKDYDSPLVEIKDEDGYGIGEFAKSSVAA